MCGGTVFSLVDPAIRDADGELRMLVLGLGQLNDRFHTRRELDHASFLYVLQACAIKGARCVPPLPPTMWEGVSFRCPAAAPK